MDIRNYTGERLEKHFFNRATIEHLHRYAIATKYVKNKVVLDIASGEGYGTNLLSQHANFVFGVDIDLKTIEEAKQKYISNNINFLEGNTSEIPLEDDSVDVVVSFETIEHHSEHQEMIREIKRVLKKGGILIISTPDKKIYSDERKYSNPYHVKELYNWEFQNLLTSFFSNVLLFGQEYVYGSSIIYNLEQKKNVFFKGDFNFLEQLEFRPKFIVALVSDNSFDFDEFSVFDGASNIKNYEDQVLINHYKTSYSYRVGQFVLFPLKLLKRLLKS